jgi:hypothetical protein
MLEAATRAKSSAGRRLDSRHVQDAKAAVLLKGHCHRYAFDDLCSCSDLPCPLSGGLLTGTTISWYKALRPRRRLQARHALSRCVRQGGPDGRHTSLHDGPPDAVQRSLSLTGPMLWVVGLACGPRDLVAANAGKAVPRTIAVASAIFMLLNTVASPGWVGYLHQNGQKRG